MLEVTADAGLLPPRVGPYQPLGLLGEGGMGRVYRARHGQTGQIVALKTASLHTPNRLLAMRLEIAALHAVSHPGVVRIVDEGNDDGPWYAMELLEGNTLADCNAQLTRDAISEARLTAPAQTCAWTGLYQAGGESRESSAPTVARGMTSEWLERTLRLYRALCEPLAHIHALGMVHRDLKPSNVFVRSDDTPVLVDFGLIAYAQGGLGREVLHAGERAFGTPYYVAPEYLEGRQVDARADLYALGCMIYEPLCGRPPFEGTPTQICNQHLHAPPPVPSHSVHGLPAALDALVAGLLAKSARERIGRASDVAAVLDGLLGHSDSAKLRSTPAQLYRPNLSGRADVVALIDEHLRQAAQGRGSFVLLSGESGVGKTFLASDIALRSSRARLRVVTGECLPVSDKSAAQEHSAGALHPLRTLLQAVADTCHANAAERDRILADRVEHLLPYESGLAVFRRAQANETTAPALPGSAAKERALGALRETLSAWLDGAPTLLLLDDLQWADDLTFELLSELNATFFAQHPLLLVATCRAEEVPAPLQRLIDTGACRCIALRRLDTDAVSIMIADMLATANPPPALVERIGSESEGNPFFVAEYLRYLVSENALVSHGGSWRFKPGTSLLSGVAAPYALRELLVRRLQALSAATRAVMGAAAVIGRHFDLELLAEVSQRDIQSVLHALHEAQARQVVETIEAAHYRFAHDKIRETCYGEPDAARRELHARCAHAIETRQLGAMKDASLVSELAHHYRSAGNDQKALEYLEKAGVEALGKTAPREAAGLLQQALTILQRLGDTTGERALRIESHLADALQMGGEFAQSIPHLQRVLRLLGQGNPGTSTPRLVVALGSEVVRQGFHRARYASSRTGQRSDAQRDAVAQTFDRLQQAFYYLGEALPMVHACVTMLNRTELSPPGPALTVAYSNAHAVAGVIPWRGLVGVYRGLARRNMALAPDAVADSYFLMLSGVYQTGVGAWQDAFEVLSRGFEIARQARYSRRMRETAGALGVASFLRGQFHMAREYADTQDRCGSQQDTQIRCWAHLGRAQVALVFSDLRQAQRELAEADLLTQQLGRPERIWSHCLQAAAHCASGHLTDADSLCSMALEDMRVAPPVIHHSIDAYRAVAEVAVALVVEHASLGRPRAALVARARLALTCLDRISRLFPVGRARYQLIQGQAAWLIDGDRSAAQHAFRASLREAQRFDMPFDAARAHLALARVQSGAPACEADRAAVELLAQLSVTRESAGLFGLTSRSPEARAPLLFPTTPCER